MSNMSPIEQPTIVLTPAKAAVSNRGCTLDVLVRVQAPDMPKGDDSRQKPKRLSLVIDRSGSMHGEPLTEALRCANHIASRMTAADELAVIVYDNKVTTVVPLAPVRSHQDIAARLADVVSGGNTALFDGWERGAQILQKGAEEGLSHVILLSDGQANEGLTESDQITPHCAQWLSKGISTTTVGLGRGFNEELMAAMAKSGGGQHYYGQTAADLFDAFDEEFALLTALYLKSLGVRFIPGDGVILEPVGIFSQKEDGFYKLSDLAYGAEAWMAVRLYLKAAKDVEVRDLFAVAFKADNLNCEAILPMMEMLSLPVMEQEEFDALEIDPLVLRRTMEAEFAKESKGLHLMARAGDLSGLNAALDDLQLKFGNHPWLHDKIAYLRALAEEDVSMAAKESQVLYFRCAARLSDRDEIAYDGDETDMSKPAFLRKKVSEGRGRRIKT